MNTSSRAIELLQGALKTTREAGQVVENLIVEHEYQDVAGLTTQAAAALLEAVALMMQNEGDAALDMMEKAEDLLDAVYNIIDGEIDDEG